MKVLVTGASGRLGRVLVQRLVAEELTVRCLVHRRPVAVGHEHVRGSLAKPSSAVEGVSAVVHLAAVTHARSAREYERVNVDGTRNLLEAAARAGVSRFVFVSTRAVDPSGGAYSRSKATAEELVRLSSVPSVIVRLPEIYDTGGREGVDDLLERARRGSPIPIVGDGRDEVCPLHVADAVEACLGALMRPDVIGKTFTLAGDCMTTRAFAEAAVEAFGSRSRIVNVPVPIVRGLSLLARVLPLPLYPDQLTRLQVPKPPPSDEARLELGFRPRPLSEGLSSARR